MPLALKCLEISAAVYSRAMASCGVRKRWTWRLTVSAVSRTLGTQEVSVSFSPQPLSSSTLAAPRPRSRNPRRSSLLLFPFRLRGRTRTVSATPLDTGRIADPYGTCVVPASPVGSSEGSPGHGKCSTRCWRTFKRQVNPITGYTEEGTPTSLKAVRGPARNGPTGNPASLRNIRRRGGAGRCGIPPQARPDRHAADRNPSLRKPAPARPP